jgi:hypothetical protein
VSVGIHVVYCCCVCLSFWVLWNLEVLDLDQCDRHVVELTDEHTFVLR